MKLTDIRKAITGVLKEKTGIQVRYENINKVKRPCFFIDLVDYSKEFDSNYRELKKLDFDIMYFPEDKEGNNTETIEMLEIIDDSWEIEGNKILHVLDRFLSITDVNMRIIDTIGHYMFSISLYDQYGKPYDYELMGELYLTMKEEK